MRLLSTVRPVVLLAELLERRSVQLRNSQLRHSEVLARRFEDEALEAK